MKKHFPTFFHESALEFDEIYVSAGIRGLQIGVDPRKLIEVTDAVTADLTTDAQ